jgi:hypothetical protein
MFSSRTNRGAKRLESLLPEIAIAAFLFFLASLIAAPAFASLGGNAASIEADRANLQATVKITNAQSYAIHEMTAPNGLVVREYLSAQGQVFGITWHGPARPDLTQILGTYYPKFAQVAQQPMTPARARGPLVIHQADFILEMGGHMRSLVGRAYLPQMLPAGVQAREIR